MTIKLLNLADWRVLEGKSLAFVAPEYDRDKPRRIRLDLNQEAGCNWYVKLDSGEARFLAHVPIGLQTLEFVFDGDFEISPVVPDGCQIQYWTSEAEAYWTEGDGETFSTIYERQPRNEALEWVQFQAMQNQLRRDRAHAEELAAIRALVENGNGSQQKSGIHGQQATQHKEPEPEGEGGALGNGTERGTRRRSAPGMDAQQPGEQRRSAEVGHVSADAVSESGAAK